MTKAGRQLSRRREDTFLFDDRPIKLEGFTLHARGVDTVGRPTLAQWAAALDFAIGCDHSSGFWIGALWNYAEGRRDWEDKLEQTLAELGRPLTRKTLINMGLIDRNVTPKAKQLAPSLAHADLVAALEPDEQVHWMDEAKTDGLTVRDLRLKIRASRRRAILEGQAILAGMFRVIYADPPWLYGDRPPSGSGAQQHYPGMTIEEMAKLPIAAHALPDSVLFLWTTAPMILENPGPRELIEAWGFTYKTNQVWDKVLPAGGNYVAVRHEHLLICTRGSCTPHRPVPMPTSVITERRQIGAIHSAKPQSFRQQIERMYDGPYLELFGRDPVDGWTVFGNDARLWARDASEQGVSSGLVHSSDRRGADDGGAAARA